jgi:DNA-binding Lrp family transcriptional regulator
MSENQVLTENQKSRATIHVERRRARQLAYRWQFPFCTHRDVATALEISEQQVKDDLEHLKQAGVVTTVTLAGVKIDRTLKAVESDQPALEAMRMLRSYSKFYVMVETSFDYRDKAFRSGRSGGYQQKVKEEIEKEMQDYQSGRGIIPAGVDILLGGDFDILVRLYAKSIDDVHHFVTERVRTIRHVLRTSTAWCQR